MCDSRAVLRTQKQITIVGAIGSLPLALPFKLMMAMMLGLGLTAAFTPEAPAQTAPAETQQLHGYLSSEVAALPVVGELDRSATLHLAISLPATNRALLDRMLQDVSNPKSPQYGHFLTAAEFDSQFGPSTKDYEALTAFARAKGLQITKTYAGRMVLDVAGSPAAVEDAFHIKLVTRRRSNGTTLYGPDREPSLDLSVPVLQISGLSNDTLFRRSQTGSGLNGTFTGANLRNAYAPGIALMGEGQSVGVIEFDGFFNADPLSYEATYGLNVPIQVVTLNGFSQTVAQSGPNGTPSSGADGEVAGDIEMPLAMAPKLKSVIVYEGSNFDSILAQAAETQNNAPFANQLSMSWTFAVDSGAQQGVDKLAMLGVTLFVVAGDGSAIPCPLSPPAASLILADTRALNNVTVVGGSILVMSGNGAAWASETAAVAGGGIMTSVPIPSYQAGLATQANMGSTTYRMIPDVALNYFNNFDFNTYINGSGQTIFAAAGGFSGTSAAAPLWAGYMALVNEQRQINGHPPLGFLNPTIYAIAQNPSAYAAAFHDIQQGSNVTAGCGGYQATPGYDLVTGLGTPTANLIAQLAPAAAPPPPPPPPPPPCPPGERAVLNGETVVCMCIKAPFGECY